MTQVYEADGYLPADTQPLSFNKIRVNEMKRPPTAGIQRSRGGILHGGGAS